jgi:hypothetical protein
VQGALEKQIPRGNDRKKSNGKNNSKGKAKEEADSRRE